VVRRQHLAAGGIVAGAAQRLAVEGDFLAQAGDWLEERRQHQVEEPAAHTLSQRHPRPAVGASIAPRLAAALRSIARRV